VKIVHLSYSDAGGGAAIAARRLHKGLLASGCDSTMLVAEKHTDDADIQAVEGPKGLLGRLRRRANIEILKRAKAPYMATRPPALEPFSDDRSIYGTAPALRAKAADVVSLHWVAEFADLRRLFTTLQDGPAFVWRLSDLNPFTGGCHYSGGCRKFVRHCGACPQLGSADNRDLAHAVFERKHAAFARITKDRFRIAVPSRWLADEVRKSALFAPFETVVIAPGIDIDTFQPRDRGMAYEFLGIDAGARVVLFVAFDVDNRRKGGDLLAKALAGMSCKNLEVVTVGRGEMMLPEGVRHRPLGTITNDRILSFVYSAADVFVIPSREDNSPNTVIEAMACGIPVVGFDNTGIRELVRNGETGLLVPTGDCAALRAGIERILSDGELRLRMGARARQIATRDYNIDRCVARYMALYRELAAKAPARPLQ